MPEFEHTGQIVRLYEKMNSFSVPVQIIGKRKDASLLQRIQMGAEMDAAGEVRRWEDGKRKKGSKEGQEEEERERRTWATAGCEHCMCDEGGERMER